MFSSFRTNYDYKDYQYFKHNSRNSNTTYFPLFSTIFVPRNYESVSHLSPLPTRGVQLSPVFISRKLNVDLKPMKQKLALLTKQKVMYHFQCNQCKAGYVGYASRHLHQRVDEHKGKTHVDAWRRHF